MSLALQFIDMENTTVTVKVPRISAIMDSEPWKWLQKSNINQIAKEL